MARVRNPSRRPAGAGWQLVQLAWDGSPWTLPAAPKLDDDGDPLLRIELNGMGQALGSAFTLAGTTVTWTSFVALDDEDEVIAWMVPGA